MESGRRIMRVMNRTPHSHLHRMYMSIIMMRIIMMRIIMMRIRRRSIISRSSSMSIDIIGMSSIHIVVCRISYGY